MEKDCKQTFEAEFEARGFPMAKDDLGYYKSTNTDFAYRGWEAAWKYDDVRERIYSGQPVYTTTTYFKPVDGYRFRIDEEGTCWHEEINKGEKYKKFIEEQATNKSEDGK